MIEGQVVCGPKCLGFAARPAVRWHRGAPVEAARGLLSADLLQA
jgi:hypothetical protein